MLVLAANMDKIIWTILGLNIFIIFCLVILFVNSPSKKRYISNLIRPIKIVKKKEVIEENVQSFTALLELLSSNSIGAIIVFEKETDLGEYIKSGVTLFSKYSSDLLYSIFNKTSPLHDGAVIIKDWTIESCASYFPTTKKIVPTKYGARHRAALGISEVSDSTVFVVSETNGKISMIKKGEIINLPKTRLEKLVKEELI